MVVGEAVTALRKLQLWKHLLESWPQERSLSPSLLTREAGNVVGTENMIDRGKEVAAGEVNGCTGDAEHCQRASASLLYTHFIGKPFVCRYLCLSII